VFTKLKAAHAELRVAITELETETRRFEPNEATLSAARLALTRASSRRRALIDQQILPVPASSASGFSTVWKNAGEITNRTWEGTLTLPIINSRSLSWTARVIADQTKSDRRALAACIRGSRQVLTREQAASIQTPTLIAVGTKDVVAGSAEELAAVMPNAKALPIPNRDHMLAVGDKVFKAGVLQFLEEHA